MSNERKPSEKMPKHVKSMPKSVSLTKAQLRALARTPIDFNQIRSAWYFALHTGLMFKELAVLKVSDLDTLKLSRQAQEIISSLDLPAKQPDSLVFKLPTYTNCYKRLRLWSAQAGLDFVAGFHIAVKTYRTALKSHKIRV